VEETELEDDISIVEGDVDIADATTVCAIEVEGSDGGGTFMGACNWSCPVDVGIEPTAMEEF
jgi:hypothetical protein